MPAATIDEVIADLDRVLADSEAERSRMGYFPALYRKVTVSVKEGIRDGFFEDGERMERLDVVFANRYLEAIERHRAGKPVTGSWRVAFEATRSAWPIVLQHLLLGMNAHINLDLGIAAARVASGDRLPALETDFNRINEVLARLVDGVKQELSEVWPTLRLLDRLAGRKEDVIVNFSMAKARRRAWESAQRLAPLDSARQEAVIAEMDSWVTAFGRLIRRPPPLTRFTFAAVRLGERGTVPEIIELLK